MQVNLMWVSGRFYRNCSLGLLCLLLGAEAASAGGESGTPPLDVPVKVRFAGQTVEGRIKSLSADWLVLVPTNGGKTYWINAKGIDFIETDTPAGSEALNDPLGKQAQELADGLKTRYYLLGQNGTAISHLALRNAADFTAGKERYTQYLGFRTELIKEEISQSEARDGLEWKGRLKIRARSQRSLETKMFRDEFDPKPRWDSWSDVAEGIVEEFPLMKRKGMAWETKEANISRRGTSDIEVRDFPK